MYVEYEGMKGGGGGCCVYVEYEGMKGGGGGVVCMWSMKG